MIHAQFSISTTVTDFKNVDLFKRGYYFVKTRVVFPPGNLNVVTCVHNPVNDIFQNGTMANEDREAPRLSKLRRASESLSSCSPMPPNIVPGILYSIAISMIVYMHTCFCIVIYIACCLFIYDLDMSLKTDAQFVNYK